MATGSQQSINYFLTDEQENPSPNFPHLMSSSVRDSLMSENSKIDDLTQRLNRVPVFRHMTSELLYPLSHYLRCMLSEGRLFVSVFI